jgi:hypothetical protein
MIETREDYVLFASCVRREASAAAMIAIVVESCLRLKSAKEQRRHEMEQRHTFASPWPEA